MYIEHYLVFIMITSKRQGDLVVRSLTFLEMLRLREALRYSVTGYLLLE